MTTLEKVTQSIQDYKQNYSNLSSSLDSMIKKEVSVKNTCEDLTDLQSSNSVKNPLLSIKNLMDQTQSVINFNASTAVQNQISKIDSNFKNEIDNIFNFENRSLKENIANNVFVEKYLDAFDCVGLNIRQKLEGILPLDEGETIAGLRQTKEDLANVDKIELETTLTERKTQFQITNIVNSIKSDMNKQAKTLLDSSSEKISNMSSKSSNSNNTIKNGFDINSVANRRLFDIADATCDLAKNFEYFDKSKLTKKFEACMPSSSELQTLVNNNLGLTSANQIIEDVKSLNKEILNQNDLTKI